MQTESEEYNDIVNASGFLFQIKVEHEIFQAFKNGKIKILASEHKWFDQTTNTEGFIDLILSCGTNGKMVIECKRTTDAKWFFLVPKKEDGLYKDTFANILWTMKYQDGHQVAAWDELRLNPESQTSCFCVIRGTGEKDQPMLERISSILLRSIESLAEEEFNYLRDDGISGIRFYFPVIITNSKLLVCHYLPSRIDMMSGKVIEADYEEVPFIRFTKSMSSRMKSSITPSNITEAKSNDDRTIFIINSESLINTLNKNWEFVKNSIFEDESRPWELQ